MKSTLTRKSLLVAAILLVAGAAVVFAHGGGRGYDGYGGHMRGYGGHMMDEDGYGPHMRGYGPGYGSNLSEEDAAKLRQARDQFFQETRDLRGQIDEKALALRQELNKETPDKNKLTQLQKELSNLEGQFDQKAIEHRLEVRKILPEGTMGRAGFGRGGYGRGYCW
jgi:Spy/CpxP family protein refolding chaperone